MTLDFDRQTRISGWDQEALSGASLGIVSDCVELTSIFLVSAVALGFRNFKVIAPNLDKRLIHMAKKLSTGALHFQEGYFVSEQQLDFFDDCQLLVDFTSYSLSKKILHSKGSKPVIWTTPSKVLFNYKNEGLDEILAGYTFPSERQANPINSVLLSGIVLELVKQAIFATLQNSAVSIELPAQNLKPAGVNVLQVGAGAIGNFTAYLLAPMVKSLHIIDNDEIESTNLNRQVFFYNSVGKMKSEVLGNRLKEFFKLPDNRISSEIVYLDEGFDLSGYDAVFDCVDNIQSRQIMSEKCRKKKIPLIHGGTSYQAGQAMYYSGTGTTPAERLGFTETEKEQKERIERENSCLRQPDPSVIMSNMIVSALMVDLFCQSKPSLVYYQNQGDFFMSFDGE